MGKKQWEPMPAFQAWFMWIGLGFGGYVLGWAIAGSSGGITGAIIGSIIFFAYSAKS